MKRRFLLTLFLFISPCLTPLFSHHSDSSVLKSASELSYPPFCSVNQDGEAQGFSVDLLTAALHAMNTNVEFQVGTWEKVKGLLEDGEVDVLPLVGRTPEREELFDFTFPYLEMHGVVVVRKNSIHPLGYSDLEGLKVGVMKYDNAEEFVDRNRTSVNAVRTEDFKEALTMLSQSEVDAVIIQKLLAIQLIDELGYENLEISNMLLDDYVQSFCFAVKEGDSELLSILNEGLATIFSNGTYNRIQKKWFADDGSTKRNSGTIRVGGDSHFPPYEYLDENGSPAGYNVELTKAISRVMNLDVEIILDTWSDTYQGLLSGNIDVIEGLYFSEDRARMITFSQPYTVINHSVFRRKDTGTIRNLEDLQSSVCIVLENDIMQEYADNHNLRNIILAPSLEEAFRLLNEGTGDCVLAATVPSLYLIRKNNFRNIEDSEISLQVPDYNYGSLHGNEDLIQQFSEGLKILKESGEYRQIQSRWLDVYDRHLTREEWVRILLFIILPFLAIIVLWFLWSLSIKINVIRKTKELNEMTSNLGDKISELEKAREHIQTTLHSIGDAVVSFDSGGIINQINPAAVKILNLDSDLIVGSHFSDLFHIKEVHLEQGEEIDINPMECKSVSNIPRAVLVCSKNRCRVEISCTLSPIRLASGRFIGSILVFRDISKELTIQRRLHEKSKLEEIGQLAGGIAHDFNNQLSGILGYGELILGQNINATIDRYAGVIVSNAQRSSVMVDKLLSFARKGKILNDSIDLHAVMGELLQSGDILNTENVEFHTHLKADNFIISGDYHQIYNALESILQNAIDAIRMKETAGRVIIETHNIRDPYTKNQTIRVSISDNGTGMTEDVQKKIFEPFFTTKSKATGSGMGLSAAQGIITNHSGKITFESDPGSGTSMSVILPLSVS